MHTEVVRILAVEDNPLQVRKLRMLLSELGYALVGVAPSAPEALALFEQHAPDVVLLDIQLDGDADGVDLALQLNERRPVPLIFVTSLQDRTTFERARAAGPFAFLSKPYDKLLLERSIELAVQHFAQGKAPAEGSGGSPEPADALLPDSLFLRENSRLVKVPYDKILWAEADGSYCHLHTAPRKHTARLTLKDLEEKLPAGRFVRTHRSYLVQAACIESLDLGEGQVWVGGQGVPVGRAYRDELLRRLNLVG
ncbi:LytTR family DNA-binding domain-containing protein [Hymenobacter saemangeumensis]|uniref:LytTR family DNA-binding domain-containing protein n=1 Tax=Hymenobacter saemangeumensis TaxID=1084522 RepID=A0ABP8I7Q4_9BACT